MGRPWAVGLPVRCGLGLHPQTGPSPSLSPLVRNKTEGQASETAEETLGPE